MFRSGNKYSAGVQSSSLGDLDFVVTFVFWCAASLNDINDQWHEEGELPREQAFWGDDKENLELKGKESRVTTPSHQKSDDSMDSAESVTVARTVSASHSLCSSTSKRALKKGLKYVTSRDCNTATLFYCCNSHKLLSTARIT